jgi:FlaA1/EpsC-like NDP-sugar epimerase
VEMKYGPLWPRAVAFAIALLASMWALELYSTRLRVSYFGVLLRLAASVCVATALAVVFFYLFERLYVGRLLLATTALLAFAAAALIRLLLWRETSGPTAGD